MALETELFDEVIVSTDDSEIASISREYGATTPWIRSAQLSDDFATTISVMQDAVNQLRPTLGDDFDVCCIYPTTPLLKPTYVSLGFKILQEGGWDYVISAVRNHVSPSRFFSLNSVGQVKMFDTNAELKRSQDLETTFHDAGQFYWGRSGLWSQGMSVFSSMTTIVEIPPWVTVDIDSLDDWHLAERLFVVQNTH